MSEVARLKGLLREKELQAKDLELRMQANLEALHAALPRYAPLASLSVQVAVQEVLELAARQMTLLALVKDIEAIKRELGD